MSELHIKIKEVGDHESKFPDHYNADQLHLDGVLIVEQATMLMNTGVAFYFTDKTGSRYYFNITGRMLVEGLAPAVKGAMIRFKELSDDTPSQS
jgi:hypothetical protein